MAAALTDSSRDAYQTRAKTKGETVSDHQRGPNIDLLQMTVADVLVAVTALQADFDAFKARLQPTPSLSPLLLAISAVGNDTATRLGTLSDLVIKLVHGLQATTQSGLADIESVAVSRQTTLLADIAAMFLLASQTAAANQTALLAAINDHDRATAIGLDLVDATSEPQPVPSRAGP